MNGRTFTLFIAAVTMLLAVPAFAKDIRYPFKNASAVVFSHDSHLAKLKKDCKTCHSAIFDISKKRHYTMAEMENGKSCGTCHNGKKAFSVATDKDCQRCHTGMPRAVVRKTTAGDAVFSHDSHVSGKGYGCKSCHGKMTLRGTMAEMDKGKSCGTCHNGKKAFATNANCGSCHRGLSTKDLSYPSKGVSNAVFSHANHLKKYSTCAECHTAKFNYKQGSRKATMAEMEKGKSCGSCHNGKTAFSVAGDCAKCHKGLKPANLTFKNSRGTVVGYFSHDFHTAAFGCQDCHSKLFPMGGGKRMTMADMATGKSCGACHDGKTAFSTKGDCAKCHKKK